MTSGEWLAPYTGTVVTDPGKLDIDHMVPLGNAHASGAWHWSANHRERYANYLDDPQHLIAVTASANRSKGARGPEDWKPEDSSYWCQYAVDWITIKDDWGLTVTQREHDALVEMLNTCANSPQLTVSHQRQVSPTPVRTHQPAGATDGNAYAADENLRQLRRRAGSGRAPRTGQQGRRQRLPEVDGSQRPRR